VMLNERTSLKAEGIVGNSTRDEQKCQRNRSHRDLCEDGLWELPLLLALLS
jgi:hypothetical protein